ncbi:MAG: TrbG/VirB9 family P-type conjugative transfer protein [Acidobacteriaceae bacterium]
MNKLPILPLVLGLVATVAHGQQQARIVHYHANEIISIRARMHYTTLIEFPSTEKIMEVATGDKDFWIIDAVGNYCFLHPAKAGIQSDLDLITNKGNVYSFALKDDEAADPDLKVVIEPSDPSSLAAASSPVKWVPATEVTSVEERAKALRQHDADAVEEFRANYPIQKLKFDYSYKNKQPFDIAAIYHDDKFTYIKSAAAEKFAVYEVKDGKPDLINFQLQDGTYIIPQIVDKGYLRIGKHKLVFERKGK